MHCDCNINDLITDLLTNNQDVFLNYKKIENENIAMYDPIDGMWQDHANDWLWHLKKIQADLAWNITRGNPNIKIAVIDTEFDITHPDLSTKIFPSFDPYDNIAYDCTPTNVHGTYVASFVAGETTEQGGTSLGQLASVGFNCMMIGYRAWSGNYLQRALHASNVMKANIITSSAGGWSYCPDLTGVDALVVQEILDNGTVIVMPAGNGTTGTHNVCTSIDPINHTAFFPLSPFYDERIILVSSTTINDYHQYIHTDGIDRTHSHYPMVDLCSPGYNIMGAKPTDCGTNTWPYYGSSRGTSFASPIVAGVAALVLSVNPCLSPAEVQSILKSTTDPIVDASSYPNGVGTGRVNAYKAVLKAQGESKTINSGDVITWNSFESINGTLLLQSNSQLTIQSKIYFNQNSNIVIKNGAKLIIDNGGLLTNFCDKTWSGIVVEPGGIVEIYNGATVMLNGTGKIQIQRSGSTCGHLYFEQGASIVLQDPETKLEIDGQLHIADNATFSFTGNGFIDFKTPWIGTNSILCGTNSQFILNGTGKDNLMLKISSSGMLWPQDHLSLFSIKNAKVDLQGSLNLGCKYRIDNVKFENGGTLDVWKGHPSFIHNSDFIGVSILGHLIYADNVLKVWNCNFTDNGNRVAIKTEGAGVYFRNLHFNNCDLGAWEQTGMLLNSYVYSCSFSNIIDYPIYCSGSVGTLNLINNTIMCIGTDPILKPGVFTEGPLTVNMRCNTITNAPSAVYVKNGGVLNMSTNLGNGYNNLSGNERAIKLEKAGGLNIDNGYNNFAKYANHPGLDSQTGLVIEGSIFTNTPDNIAPILANNNKWLYLSNGYPSGKCHIVTASDIPGTWPHLYSVIDESPSPVTSCGSQDNPPTPNNSNLLRVCTSCINITTPHFNNTSFNEAVRIAISNMEIEDSTKNDLTAITMFKEILLSPIPANNTSMKWLSELAFAKMNTALSNTFTTGRITTADNTTTLHTSVQDVLTVYSSLSAMPTATNYLNQFYLDYSKAQIYRLAGRYDLATNYLDNISNCYIGNEEIRLINNAKIIVEAEQKFITEEIGIPQYNTLMSKLIPPVLMTNEISDNANINITAKLGQNVTIGDNTTIEQNVTIGNNVTIGSNVTIKKDCIIKDGASISDNTVIEKGNIIGADNIIGKNVTIKKECSFGEKATLSDFAVIEENSKIGGYVLIGTNTKFQKNANIADGTSIGANGNIDKDIKIGSNVTILDNAILRKEVQISDRTVIGNSVTINQNAKIGSGVTIANNINIGSNARVTDNQTITTNVSNNANIGIGTLSIPAIPGTVVYDCNFALTNAKLRVNMLNGFAVTLTEAEGSFFATGVPLNVKPTTLSLNNQWNFGDCTTSNEESPVHTYTKPGVYTITLTQVVKCTTVTYTGAITVYLAPNAEFSYQQQPLCSSSNKYVFNKTNNVGDLQTILFNCQTGLCSNDPVGLDTSLYRIKYNWTFGDIRPAFSETFTLKQIAQNIDSNVTCMFPQAGEFPVTLTATLEVKNKTTNIWTITDIVKTYTDTVKVTSPIIADFEFTQPECYNDSVYFTNTTTQGVLPYNFNWSFAFHAASTIENPVYKYSSAGIYDVSLIATDALGCKDTAIKQIIIPECEGIYGYLSEHSDCGGSPVINDTLYLIDEFGYTYDTLFAVTDFTGQFTFDMSKINLLDTNYNYSFKIKSGYGITETQYNTISYWKNSSPLSFITDHKEFWSRNFNMSDSANCTSTAIDIDRNIYVAGTAFYPAYRADYLLIKYDPLGNELWHVSYNPSGFGYFNLTDMKIDKMGNCILTGYGDDGTLTVKINASGTVLWSSNWIDNNYFGESAYLAIDTLDNIYLASNVSDYTGLYYFALTKYNNSGQKLWSSVYNTDSMTVRSIKKDNIGNIVVLCTQLLNNSNIFKYNSSGVLLWVVQKDENLIDLATDLDNSIYITGSTSNNTKFITIKLNSTGTEEWQQFYSYSGISGSNIANKITVDHSGNIISVGTSPALSTLYFGVWIPHNRYSYVKYSPAGDELWNTSFITGFSLGSVQSISSMVTDREDNIYTAGREFYSTIAGGRPAKSHAQFLATKINSDGSFAWFETDSTSKENPGQLSDLIVSDNENVYMTGVTNQNGIRTIKYVQCPSFANNARYSNPESNEQQPNNKPETTNLKPETLDEYVKMFPNPNDGNFYFTYSLPENEICKFAVYDQNGKKVYDIEIKSGKNTVMVNHANFSNGVYYYQVIAGNRLIKTERIIIAK
ncbi:MAG: hypothetical protein A2275_09720 [Bacteroidetes bacterium RIFOXYA12_FULL_35_11]|nr:MAG: hypothetical protein A2X01_18375 [Bacteroidetes bacterium GWF2_35_48]OFY76704.1 MAG: hypothetical protein A2275_09720 [Bacteroidetes bacterium RIFOXYA12_FULL_35_11]OFZ03988.1 MAG: hypothetical protein A2491_07205 [Bacteroidetes bacterium RIFOXYC12_FULL_35_7]HBX52557.1 hypothetical protein [Bacteroidales bacterium]